MCDIFDQDKRVDKRAKEQADSAFRRAFDRAFEQPAACGTCGAGFLASSRKKVCTKCAERIKVTKTMSVTSTTLELVQATEAAQ